MDHPDSEKNVIGNNPDAKLDFYLSQVVSLYSAHDRFFDKYAQRLTDMFPYRHIYERAENKDKIIKLMSKHLSTVELKILDDSAELIKSNVKVKNRTVEQTNLMIKRNCIKSKVSNWYIRLGNDLYGASYHDLTAVAMPMTGRIQPTDIRLEPAINTRFNADDIHSDLSFHDECDGTTNTGFTDIETVTTEMSVMTLATDVIFPKSEVVAERVRSPSVVEPNYFIREEPIETPPPPPRQNRAGRSSQRSGGRNFETPNRRSLRNVVPTPPSREITMAGINNLMCNLHKLDDEQLQQIQLELLKVVGVLEDEETEF